jgi:hypothetical protein
MTRAIVVPALALILLGSMIWEIWNVKKSQNRRENLSWEELLAQLRPMTRVGIEEVATVFLFPSSEQLDARCSDIRLESQDVWDFIGGVEGIETMRHNARVLIDLAYYVQRWNPQASLVAEQLRLDANQIRVSLSRIQASKRNGTLDKWFPIHATRATAAYYLMTRRLYALYEVSNAGLLNQLKASI